MMDEAKAELKYEQNSRTDNLFFLGNKTYTMKNVGATVVATLFAGATLLHPMSGDVIDCCNNVDSSYIKNINLGDLWENQNIIMNNTIDLLKIQNINKLNKMKRFVEDWNGYGAPAYSNTAIMLYVDIIESLCKQPQIAPTGKASLLMQYELSDKSLLAFDVCENKAEMVFVPQGDYSRADAKIFTENICENINLCVERFYGIRQN